MEDNLDFDILIFKKKVVGELSSLKVLRNKPFKTDFSPRTSVSKKGCLLALFVNILDIFANRVRRKYEEDSHYVLMEIKAKDLLAQPKIQETFCLTLKKINNSKILDEDLLIETVIRTFGEKKMRILYSFELDPVLFAFISYNLLKIDIKEFCN